MDLGQNIIDATLEIFDSMLMVTVEPGAVQPADSRSWSDAVSGIIGMAGGHKGILAIHAPNQVAMEITSTFLGLEVEDVNEDVKDAIGEMANMLAGSVKSCFNGQGEEIKLSIPTAVCGADYKVECATDAEGVMVPFSMPAGGEFAVELRLQSIG